MSNVVSVFTRSGRLVFPAAVCALAIAVACSRSAAPAAPTAPAAAATTAADGTTLKVSAPAPTSPISGQQVTDNPTLTATASTGGGTAALQYRFQLFNESGTKVEESDLVTTPSYKVTSTLDFAKNYTWRARAEYQSHVGPWSAAAAFVSPEGGYIHTGEVFDPITNGKTVGERFGATTFLGTSGIRLDTGTSYVRYTIPGSVTAGEFSMEVSGLAPNGPGDKVKVLSMSSNGPDFITDDYRVDVQYRGITGVPPNSITFRALYGSATDLSKRYEPDTATRNSSVFNLSPSVFYYWKFTWGSEARVTVRAGGINGPIIYNVGVASPIGTYRPSPWYAYLGAPSGRSGTEAASPPGAIYRNVWISSRARPQ
jgi:hypothetical protein